MVLCKMCVYEAERGCYHTVDSKVYEFAFLYYIYHPLASKATRHKGCEEAHNERSGRDISHDVFASYHLDDVE